MEENMKIIQTDELSFKTEDIPVDLIDDFSNIQQQCAEEAHDVKRCESMREEFTSEPSDAVEPEIQRDENDRTLRRCITITKAKYKYTGESINNRRDGFGICYYNDGGVYIGQWRNDIAEGWGKIKKANNQVLQGEFKNNVLNGYCEKITEKETWIGFCENGKFVGEIIKKTDKKTIEAILGQNIYKQIYSENQYYMGDDTMGIMVNESRTYCGYMTNKQLNGYGEVYYKDGSKYFGKFSNGKRNGFGIIVSKDGKTFSMGYFIDEAKNGVFLITLSNSFKIELYHFGFKIKTVDKYETCNSYVKLNYPEHYHMLKLNYKRLTEVFKPDNL